MQLAYLSSEDIQTAEKKLFSYFFVISSLGVK